MRDAMTVRESATRRDRAREVTPIDDGEKKKRCARGGSDDDGARARWRCVDARDDARSMDVSVSRNGIAMECVATTDDRRRCDEN